MEKCPHCHNPIMLSKPPGVHRFEFSPGVLQRGRRYDQEAAQTLPAPAQLGPGETVYRPFSVRHDIGPQLAFAGVYVGFFILGAIGIKTQQPVIWAADGIWQGAAKTDHNMCSLCMGW